MTFPSIDGWVVLTIGVYGLSLWAIVLLLRQRKQPMATLSWILGILLLPALGRLLYFLIGERRVRRRLRRIRKREAYIVRALQVAGAREERAGARFLSRPEARYAFLDEDLEPLARISARLSQYPLTVGNKVEAYTTPQRIYDEILSAIDSALDHVHLEYYIFRPDSTGKLFVDGLTAKARQGVEVRLLLDAIGAWSTSRRFLRPLLQAGGKVDWFLPAIPLRRHWNINCRNHRKIVVVDGEVAFTGSQNIGDEYRGRVSKWAGWKDTQLRVEGPAAQQLQDVFVEDWYFASGEDLTSRRYLKGVPARGDSLVQIVPSGPDQDRNVLAQIYFSAFNSAKETIRILTPYFVPDPGILLALQNAAYRGVLVEILIPSKTDAPLVLWAGRSYYQELLEAGVKVYEFDAGFLHSKTITIDGRWSLAGSANMDVRSFLLNFEATATVFDPEIARDLDADFIKYRDRSRTIPRLKDSPGPFLPSVIEGAARILSPLL